MADERKCYAGDLGSDALGKTIVFSEGKNTRVVQVRRVAHSVSRVHPGTKITTIHGPAGGMYVVPDATLVEVRR